MENSPDKYINITENNFAARIYTVKYLTTLERFPALPRYKQRMPMSRWHTQLET
jgi:hypothetical protein